MLNLLPRKKNPTMIKPAVAFLTALLLLAGCDKGTLLHSYQPLKDNCWERRDTITFALPVLTQDDNCSVLIGLRVNNQFPYQELVLQVEQCFQHPTLHQIDTIYYRLTDQGGEFTEEGVNFFQFETQGLHLDLKEGQTGEIRIRHLMNKEEIPGITDVGIHIIR